MRRNEGIWKEKERGGWEEEEGRRGGVKERRGVGMRRKGGFFRFPPLSSKPFYIFGQCTGNYCRTH